MKWTDIDGWFTEADAGIYRKWAKECPAKCTIVELGTWFARSANCLLEELDRAGKPDVRVVCIDCFPRQTLPVAAATLCRWAGRVRIVQWDTCAAAALFAPKTVYAVYIDADHSYEGTLAAIHAWLPKIRQDGRIGGHDYQPPTPEAKGWPGVVQAVREMQQGQEPPTWGTSWELLRY